MTINDLSAASWQDLQSARFNIVTPFTLPLADGTALMAEKVIRMIPARRIVVMGVWQGKSVVAKLFLDPKRSQQHLANEVTGIQSLVQHKIPTPALLYHGTSADKGIQVLILERIIEAENLADIWQDKNNQPDVLTILKAMMVELATQHVLGVLQHDMHFKNFLITEKIIYTLDGAQIEFTGALLPAKPSMQSLALFLAQLGVGMEAYQQPLFMHYAKARGWRLKETEIAELWLTIKKCNDERWRRFEKKIFRDSSAFVKIKNSQGLTMYQREAATPEFLALLEDPERAFTHPSVQVLKAGRSATVVKITLAGRELVVKRYNLKNTWHKLRRCLRPTRAAACWRLAHKLTLFGVLTAKPVAFIERRVFGLRGQSYFIMEYVQGEPLQQYLTHCANQDQIIKRVIHLLRSLAKLEVTHGDLKSTNILINAESEPVLIDLDGAREHFSLTTLRQAWQKEIKRFLQNFHSQPLVLKKFEDELQ